jgi:hypothetical protein
MRFITFFVIFAMISSSYLAYGLTYADLSAGNQQQFQVALREGIQLTIAQGVIPNKHYNLPQIVKAATFTIPKITDTYLVYKIKLTLYVIGCKRAFAEIDVTVTFYKTGTFTLNSIDRYVKL